MKRILRQLLKDYRLTEVAQALPQSVAELLKFLAIPTPDTPQVLRRIRMMEREIILPLKVALIAILIHSFYFTPWFSTVTSLLEVPVESTQYFLWFYILVNAVMAGLLFNMRRLPPELVEWAVFASVLLDGIFLGALTLLTGGYNSLLYWLFLGLILRTAVSVPRGMSQLSVNLTLTGCYVMAGVIDNAIAQNLSPTEKRVLEIYTADNPAEPLLLRLLLLVLMTFGCYGVQVLLERQRLAEEEAREFAFREGQLRSAGRLAAEFAHQLKNPLAIINNATFSLDRFLKQGRRDVAEQIQIIQEEVARSDRIITELMGYAQLSEGRVERLDALEELDRAIMRVFPPAAGYAIRVHKDYAGAFPPLLMQRRHLSETFVNVLQNAREALGGHNGNVWVTARCQTGYLVQVTIRDDGPGIAADKQGRIFEAYYTTKEKGTGLGLATVKHNVELYGGKVRVESELGKGARFILHFPAKTLTKPTNA